MPGHGNNVVDRINATDKHYLKGKIELLGKLASSDTSKIGMLPSEKCIHIINITSRPIKNNWWGWDQTARAGKVSGVCQE